MNIKSWRSVFSRGRAYNLCIIGLSHNYVIARFAFYKIISRKVLTTQMSCVIIKEQNNVLRYWVQLSSDTFFVCRKEDYMVWFTARGMPLFYEVIAQEEFPSTSSEKEVLDYFHKAYKALQEGDYLIREGQARQQVFFIRKDNRGRLSCKKEKDAQFVREPEGFSRCLILHKSRETIGYYPTGTDYAKWFKFINPVSIDYDEFTLTYDNDSSAELNRMAYAATGIYIYGIAVISKQEGLTLEDIERIGCLKKN